MRQYAEARRQDTNPGPESNSSREKIASFVELESRDASRREAKRSTLRPAAVASCSFRTILPCVSTLSLSESVVLPWGTCRIQLVLHRVAHPAASRHELHPPLPAHMANRGSVQRGCSAASAPAPPTHDDDDDDADSDDQWEDGGVEDWDEPENAPTRCLFTDQEFASPAECLAHAASSHALDLHLLIARLKLDLYDKMKLVNFLRTSLRTPGADVAAVVAAVVACQPGAPELWPWSDDTNLQPVLADDPLLYSLSMDDEEADEAEEQACKCTCTCTRARKCTCTWTCPCTCRGVGGRARVLALT